MWFSPIKPQFAHTRALRTTWYPDMCPWRHQVNKNWSKPDENNMLEIYVSYQKYFRIYHCYKIMGIKNNHMFTRKRGHIVNFLFWTFFERDYGKVQRVSKRYKISDFEFRSDLLQYDQNMMEPQFIINFISFWDA